MRAFTRAASGCRSAFVHSLRARARRRLPLFLYRRTLARHTLRRQDGMRHTAAAAVLRRFVAARYGAIFTSRPPDVATQNACAVPDRFSPIARDSV